MVSGNLLDNKRFTFALARFGRFLSSQAAEIIQFDSDGIALVNGGKLFRRIPWVEIKNLEFVHSMPSRFPLANLLGGALSPKSEFCFYIDTENGNYEFYLEQDAEYKRNQLKELLAWLYTSGIDLSEKFSSGGPTFLMESVSAADLEKKKSELKSGRGFDE